MGCMPTRYNLPAFVAYLPTKTSFYEDKKFQSLLNQHAQAVEEWFISKSFAEGHYKVYFFAQMINRYLELDADKQGIASLLNHPDMSEKQKLHILSFQQQCRDRTCWITHGGVSKPLCEEELFTHPPCRERIAILEAAKNSLLPLVAYEYGADTMRLSFDPDWA